MLAEVVVPVVDVIQGIGILALAVAVVCQVKINRELMRQIDLLHNDGRDDASRG